jgi:hypothetical protein
VPIELQPVLRDYRPTYKPPSGDRAWLSQQEYQPDRIERNMGAYRRGSISGGPTYQQFLELDNPAKFAVIPPPPPLLTPVMNGQDQRKSGLGSFDLDLLDPLTSFEQWTGDSVGLAPPGVGSGGLADPRSWLQDRQISVLGGGGDSSGAPARIADYALALPAAVLNRIAGIKTTIGAVAPDPDMPYAFQHQPEYWNLVSGLDEGQLRMLARETVANRGVNPDANSYLVSQLYSTFAADKNRALGLSSGNERVDYLAKLALGRDLAGEQAGYQKPKTMAERLSNPVPWDVQAATMRYGVGAFLSVLPAGGTALSNAALGGNELGNAWAALTPDQRRQYLAEAGATSAITEVVAGLPALSGIGAMLEIAKGAGGLAATAYRAYDLTLKVANWTLAAGVASMTATWAGETFAPGLFAEMGEEIDRSRPISGSVFAGAVNAVGFWSSGTLGAYTAGRVGAGIVARGARFAAGKAGLELPALARELKFFRDGHGGGLADAELVRAGLSPELLRLSHQGSFMSYALNSRLAAKVRRWEGYIRGEKSNDRRLDAITDPAEREAEASAALSRSQTTLQYEVQPVFDMMAASRRGRPIGNRAASDERAVVDHIAETFDDEIASGYVHDYGPAFLTHLAGAYTPEALEAYVRGAVTRLGGDASQLGRHGLDDWAKRARSVYQYEFHAANGELHAAAAGSEEAARLSMFSQRTLFDREAADALEVLTGADGAAAQALTEQLIRDKDQIARWYAEKWNPERGVAKTPAGVKPSAVASFIEDVLPTLPSRRELASNPATMDLPLNAFAKRLEEDGRWTIGFKPVNAEGQFVSYVKTRGGAIFTSPWLDYPIHNIDNIEMGNRGWMASKLDSVFGGFRTWRLSEFQRGSLFREITGRFPTVTPEQIDAFHQGVLEIARDYKVHAQTTGTLQRDAVLMKGLTDAVDDLAARTFGSLPLRDRAGKLVDVDWPKVIGKAYQQSLKLNLTAGVTSKLKSMGGIGPAVALASDVAYVEWRFNRSPIFKAGEFAESAQFNVMRGVNPQGDPITEALFYRGGVGNDYGVVNQELIYDQMLQGLSRRHEAATRDPRIREAASLSFYARKLPRTLELDGQIAAAHGAADAVRANEMQLDDAIAGIRRDGEAIDPETGELLGPDDIGDLEHRAMLAREAEPELPPVAGDREDLLAQFRATLANEPTPSDKTLNALQSELNDMVGENGIYPGLERRAIEVLDAIDEIRLAEARAHGGPVFHYADAPESLVERFHAEHPEMAPPEGERDAFFHGTTAEAAAAIERDGFSAEQFGSRDRGPLAEPDYRGVWLTRDRAKARDYYATSADRPTNDVLGGGPVLRVRADSSRFVPREEWRRLKTEADIAHLDANGDRIPGSEQAVLDEQVRLAQAAGYTGVSLRNGTEILIFDARDAIPVGRIPDPATRDAAFADFQRGESSADGLDEVAGTPEALEALIEQRAAVAAREPGKLGQAWHTFWNPTQWKIHQADLLQMKLMSDEFPHLLAASGNERVAGIFRELGIPEKDWATWMLKDRELLDEFAAAPEAGRAAAFEKMIAHAGNDATRADFDELYASPTWDVITNLWGLNAKATQLEAFGVHFFRPYRSAFGRSINHPLLALYPAAWAYKAAREWAKFLYDNRTFGELRLGMAPAVALSQINHTQQTLFAQSNETSLADFYLHGPLKDGIFIFNLIMPGDWSSIPFPASRTIREVVRGVSNGTLDPAAIAKANWDFTGLSRDLQKITGTLGEMGDLIHGVPAKEARRRIDEVSFRGYEGAYGLERR